MTSLPLKALLPLLVLVFIASCSGGGTEGTGAGVRPDEPGIALQPGIALPGLSSCEPQSSGQSLLCGSVTTDDGVTPVPGVEVRLGGDTTSSSSRSTLSSRGIADNNQCLTDSNGEYACVLPSDISGNQTFNLVPPNVIDFEPGSFQVDVQAGDTTTAQPQVINSRSAVNLIDDSANTRYVTSTCDSLSIQPVEASSVQDRPTALLIGAVAEAQLSAPGDDGDTHYWIFQLSAGTYHLVIDTVTVNWILGMGISASIYNLDDSKLGPVISFSGTTKPRKRSHASIIVEKDMSLVIQTKSRIELVPYRLGLFEEDMAVPSPYFADCPDVVNTSIGTTESSSFGRWDERWFSLEMQPGVYDVTINSFVGRNGAHQYSVYALSEFAQSSTEIKLASTNNIDDNLTLTRELTVEQGGQIYFRFINSRVGFLTNFDLTINAR